MIVKIMSEVSRWEFTHNPDTPIPELDNKKMVDIADDWVSFFLSVPEEDHPHSHSELTLNRRKQLDAQQENFHGSENESKTGVWHLLQGFLAGFYTTYLPPPRKWAIMFSPYITVASTAEFPSLTTAAQLDEFTKKDTDAVFQLDATINDERLMPVRIAGSVEVDIKGNNLFGINPTPNVEVVYNGYFNLLKPVLPGDYLIRSRGYSPNFQNDVRYAVYSRSP
jgi:hypothetical protein